MADRDANQAPHPAFGGITIRTVAEADAEALSRFYLGLSARSDYFFRPYRDKSPAAMAHVIRQSFGGHEDGYLVLDRSGSIMGHLFFGAVSQEVPHLGIGLADEHQDSGLGTMLLQFLIAVGRRKLGKRAIGLSVMKTNTRAIQVYQRCGFRIRGQCSFRSENDSYVMELEYGASRREDLERVEEHYRRSLGIGPDAPGGESVTICGMEEDGPRGTDSGWSLEIAALLRRGRCRVAAKRGILEPVREVLSGVGIPEAVFGEDLRARLAGVVEADIGGNEKVPSRWSVSFYCPQGALRYHPDPWVRRATPEEAEGLRRRMDAAPVAGSGALEAVGPAWVAQRAEERGGELDVAFGEEVGVGGDTSVVVVTAAAIGEPADASRFAPVLSPLVAELQGAGSLVIAEPLFDDVSLIRALESAGMESYGHLFRVWRRMG